MKTDKLLIALRNAEIIDDQSTVYHMMSRTALDGYPLGDVESGITSFRLPFSLRCKAAQIPAFRFLLELPERVFLSFSEINDKYI